jgi:hypothetical protein
MNKICKALPGSPIQIRLRESPDGLLLSLWDFDVVKRSLAPFDDGDVGDGKLHCDLSAACRSHGKGKRTKCFAVQTEAKYRRTASEEIAFPKVFWTDVFQLDLASCVGRRPGVAPLHLVNSWAWVVGSGLLETDSVHHDPAFNVPTDYLALVVYEERFPLILSMVDAHQEDKIAAAPDQLLSDSPLLGVVLKGICLQMFDSFCSPKDWDLDACSSFAKCFPIGVQIATLDVHILRTVHFRLLFALVE